MAQGMSHGVAQGYRVYYLGGLVPSVENGGKQYFDIRANDKLIRFENKPGAYIDLSLEVQAEDLVATHRLLTKHGDFPAFTRDPREVQMAMRNKQKRKPMPQISKEDVIKSLSREELLAILNDMDAIDEDEELMGDL